MSHYLRNLLKLIINNRDLAPQIAVYYVTAEPSLMQARHLRERLHGVDLSSYAPE